MKKYIGWLMVLTHDIHYGYEGGYRTNYTIESKEDLTEDQIRAVLEKHFNEGKSIQKRKDEWLDFMPEENPFGNDELTFDEHNKYASREVTIKL